MFTTREVALRAYKAALAARTDARGWTADDRTQAHLDRRDALTRAVAILEQAKTTQRHLMAEPSDHDLDAMAAELTRTLNAYNDRPTASAPPTSEDAATVTNPAPTQQRLRGGRTT